MEIYGIKISRGLFIMLVTLFIVAFIFPLLRSGSRPDVYEQLEQQQKSLKIKAEAEYDAHLTSLGVTDPNLRACASRIMYDHSGNGAEQIDTSDVVSLYCPNQNITSAAGLSVFSKLLFLDLSNNSINEMRFSAKQRNLQQLKLSGNPLRSLKGMNQLNSLVLLRLPDVSWLACKKLYSSFGEIDQNLSSIKCQGENNAVLSGRDYVLEQRQSERDTKKKKSSRQKSETLNSRQERELLEYENRYGR